MALKVYASPLRNRRNQLGSLGPNGLNSNAHQVERSNRIRAWRHGRTGGDQSGGKRAQCMVAGLNTEG